MQKLIKISRRNRVRRLAGRIGFAGAFALFCAGSVQAQVTVTTLGGGAAALKDGLTSTARFNEPFGLALDSSGNLYMADRNNNRVRKITAAGDKATSRTTSFITALNKPVDVKLDADGNLLVLTSGDGRIRKYGTGGTTGNLLSTNYAVLSAPSAFALDAGGNIYVTQTNGFLKRIAITNTAVAVTVTNGFRQPQGVAVLSSGTIAVADTGNNAIRLVNPVTGGITHLSGSTNGSAGFADGAPTTARFYQPYKIAPTANGSLVVADRYNNRVRLVLPGGTASTIYGTSSNLWVANYYPGWQDGVSTNAHAREPVGVAVASNGDVFTTEVRWDLLRLAKGGAGSSTGGPGSTNNHSTANSISFGFESGEASSEFVGAAGQTFFAPITLSLVSNQSVYSFQFNASLTNLGSAPEVPGTDRLFASFLQKPSDDTNSPPGSFVQIRPNYFANMPNLMSVGWFERYSGTNLYNTLSQDLVRYSQAHNIQYIGANGKVILGTYGFTIPTTAQTNDIYQIELGRPSGSSDGVQTDLNVQTPKTGSLQGGAINAVKNVSIGSRPYVVGDVLPFRWFNAGDFGDTYILNTDLLQVFQSTDFSPSSINEPLPGSDFFDAMDSSDGSIGSLLADDSSINNILFGDGTLDVTDLYVSFRRSLDPSLKWYARYWTNGAREVVEVTNHFPSSLAASQETSKVTKDVLSGESPSVKIIASDIVADQTNVVTIPIRAEVKGSLPIRIALLNITVQPLDNSPGVVSATFSSALGQPTLTDSKGAGNYSAAWLNRGVTGISGTNNIGVLTVTLPSGTPKSAAYKVCFNHASVSPNGLGLFPQKTINGLLTKSNRSASSQNDGIPDSWRLKYFGTISSNLLTLATADADGDNVSNVNEYKMGTDPNDVSSFLRMLEPKKQAGLTVRWPSASGRTYVVESSPALFDAPWTVISTNIAGTGDDLEFSDSAAANGTRFYRVRVLEP